MHQSKLFQLLRQLTAGQWNDLSEWMRSPLHNSSKEVLVLFNYFEKFKPALEHPSLEKSAIVTKVQKVRELNEKKLGHLSSKMMQIVESFLMWEMQDEKDFAAPINLLEYYHEAGLTNHYNAIMRKITKAHSLNPLRNTDFLFREYLLQQIQYHHSDKNLRAYNSALQKVSDSLDAFYLAEKLRHLCEMCNYEKTLNVAYSKHLQNELIAAIPDSAFYKIDAIHLYFELLELMRNDESASYFKASALLEASSEYFRVDELKWMYDILLNYCTRQVMHERDLSFQQEYFDLNKKLLEKDLLMENGQLSPWRYSNLITVALRLGQVAWSRSFVKKYKKHLPAEHRENLFYYKMGQIFYEEGEFEKAQENLVQVELKDPLLALSVKNLLVKIYFETQKEELLYSFLEAYRIYILRHELLQPEIKTQVQNFIDFTRKMLRTPDFEKEKLHSLLDQLPQASMMLHRDWVAMHLERKIES